MPTISIDCGPTLAVLRTRTVPLSWSELSHVPKVLEHVEQFTYVQLVVGSHAAGSCCWAEWCACNLIPGSKVGFEVELGVWDRVEAGPSGCQAMSNWSLVFCLPIILRSSDVW